MKSNVQSELPVWLATFVLAGAGCTFLGPFLPAISGTWHLHDHQAGLLISCLFLGSFLGTLLLSSKLRHTLRLGAVAACLGFLLFGIAVQSSRGFAVGAFALAIAGFGLGQLMSSINLLVGSAQASTRSSALAKIGAAWCVGAVLSPALTTSLLPGSAGTRLACCSFCFLLPAVYGKIRADTVPVAPTKVPTTGLVTQRISKAALFSVIIFLIYGGTEASIAGWMSMFAVRYGRDQASASEWMTSLFWAGLILGRILTSKTVTPATERAVVRLAIASSACSVLLVVASSSFYALMACCVVTGVCIAPIFPLLLSAVMECRLSPRTMGAVLAASGLGAAIVPYVLGIISSISTLRAAMLVPLASLLVLLALSWSPPQAVETGYQAG